MTHPYPPVPEGSHPRLPLVVALCLLLAGIALAGTPNRGEDMLPVAQTGAAGGDATPTLAETVLRIANGSSNPTLASRDPNNAWTDTLANAVSNKKINSVRTDGGGPQDGQVGNRIQGLAAESGERVRSGKESFQRSPVQGSVIALGSVVLVCSLVGLLGYCALVSCAPGSPSKLPFPR